MNLTPRKKIAIILGGLTILFVIPFGKNFLVSVSDVAIGGIVPVNIRDTSPVISTIDTECRRVMWPNLAPVNDINNPIPNGEYKIQVSTSALFSDIYEESNFVSGNTYMVTRTMNPGARFFYRLKGRDPARATDTSLWSAIKACDTSVSVAIITNPTSPQIVTSAPAPTVTSIPTTTTPLTTTPVPQPTLLETQPLQPVPLQPVPIQPPPPIVTPSSIAESMNWIQSTVIKPMTGEKPIELSITPFVFKPPTTTTPYPSYPHLNPYAPPPGDPRSPMTAPYMPNMPPMPYMPYVPSLAAETQQKANIRINESNVFFIAPKILTQPPAETRTPESPLTPIPPAVNTVPETPAVKAATVSIKVPESTEKKNLVMSYFDTRTNSWQKVPTYFDATSGTVNFKAGAAATFALVEAQEVPKPFKDVKKTDWFYDFAENARLFNISKKSTKPSTKKEVVKPDTEKKPEIEKKEEPKKKEEAKEEEPSFDPAAVVTRQDAYDMILQGLGTPVSEKYTKRNPSEKITRAEAIEIMLATAGFNPVASRSGLTFIDVPRTNPSYKYIAKAFQLDIIHGYSDNSFKPKNSINQAEFMKILIKTIEQRYLFTTLAQTPNLDEVVKKEKTKNKLSSQSIRTTLVTIANEIERQEKNKKNKKNTKQ